VRRSTPPWSFSSQPIVRKLQRACGRSVPHGQGRRGNASLMLRAGYGNFVSGAPPCSVNLVFRRAGGYIAYLLPHPLVAKFLSRGRCRASIGIPGLAAMKLTTNGLGGHASDLGVRVSDIDRASRRSWPQRSETRDRYALSTTAISCRSSGL